MTIQEARKQVDAVENKVNSSFHDLRSSAFGIADLVEKPKGLNTTAWISRIAGGMCFVGLILGLCGLVGLALGYLIGAEFVYVGGVLGFAGFILIMIGGVEAGTKSRYSDVTRDFRNKLDE